MINIIVLSICFIVLSILYSKRHIKLKFLRLEILMWMGLNLNSLEYSLYLNLYYKLWTGWRSYIIPLCFWININKRKDKFTKYLKPELGVIK